ncbi:hypothetical protein B296_00043140, partial [Ensete ventricosum]
ILSSPLRIDGDVGHWQPPLPVGNCPCVVIAVGGPLCGRASPSRVPLGRKQPACGAVPTNGLAIGDCPYRWPGCMRLPLQGPWLWVVTPVGRLAVSSHPSKWPAHRWFLLSTGSSPTIIARTQRKFIRDSISSHAV